MEQCNLTVLPSGTGPVVFEMIVTRKTGPEQNSYTDNTLLLLIIILKYHVHDWALNKLWSVY